MSLTGRAGQPVKDHEPHFLLCHRKESHHTYGHTWKSPLKHIPFLSYIYCKYETGHRPAGWFPCYRVYYIWHTIFVLQITQYNTSLKLGVFKKTRAYNYDWKGMGVRKGVNRHSPTPPFRKTKNSKFVANLKSGAYRLNWFHSCIDSLFPGVKRKFWPVTVHQLFCFLE